MAPNGRYVLNDLEFEKQIKEMSGRQLLEFTARQTYDVSILARSNEGRVVKLENRDRKIFGATGGIGAVFGVIIASIIDYFMRR